MTENNSSQPDTRQVRICVPLCLRRADELKDAWRRALEVADLIELRLDCLEDDAQLAATLEALGVLLHTRTRPPVIYTYRSAAQGGQHARQSVENSLHRGSTAGSFENEIVYPDFVDIELSDDFSTRAASFREHCRIICSHHNFTGLPADLDRIYEQLANTEAHVLKLAVQANDITDCLPILHLLERARDERREMIAIAMGEAGLLTRVLAPSRGAFLTFGALDQEQATAPGQIAAAELRDLYRLHTLDEETEIMGLVGSPVSHSLSPHLHNAAFAECKINSVYLPFEVRDVATFMRRMVDPRTRELPWRLRGLSVTAPHKKAIMSHLDWIAPVAQEIGAVNTIIVKDDQLHGYNTDADAALAPLRDVLELRDAQVAVIGAGGASRAVLWSLRQAGARTTIFARSLEHARLLADNFNAQLQTLEDARFNNFDLVINATPLGTRGDLENETPATADQLHGAPAVYDLVYNPAETRFMHEARAAGCARVFGGLDMLIAQAAAQFILWSGQATAPLLAMRASAEKRLAAGNE